jgi:hypothetical protein
LGVPPEGRITQLKWPFKERNLTKTVEIVVNQH